MQLPRMLLVVRNGLMLWVLVSVIAACGEEAPPLPPSIRAIKTHIVTEIASGQVRKFTATIRATDQSVISFQVGGNVKEVRVNRGDRVKKGQILAVLDKQVYELDVKAAEAALRKARANLEQKQLEYARQKTLFDKGWIAKSRLDRVKNRSDAALSDVDYAASKLNLAKRNLRLTTLIAPFDGNISGKFIDPFVEVRAGQKIFLIEAKGSLEARFDIPESTISRVTVGMPVTIRFTTGDDCVCKGRITEIGSAAGQANAFPVKAVLSEPPATVRSGMTAEVSVLLKQDTPTSAYLVPLAAIAPSKTPNEGFVFVFDSKTKTVRRSAIKIRGTTDNLAHVYDGVKAGDVLAAAGVVFLSDGQKVKLMKP